MPVNLSKKIIRKINKEQAESPGEDYFELPEKVLQFGTGVLLRGLPDYFIDKANKQKVFNGRIVVVKSTDSPGADAFEKQDGLYTHCIRGIVNGRNVEKNIINASVSRVLSAATAWSSVLQCATDSAMQVVISNTTEVGITLVKESIHADPPVSFPGKLLAFLYKRYKHFNGDASKGMIIIPTELIPDNGTELHSVLVQLAHQNELEHSFISWLSDANTFCNSLVDRIVPGKLPAPQQSEMEEQAGYKDELMIMSEPYCLWAIEAKNEKVRDILSFHLVDEGVVIAPDINVFRELKLRLLNGSHTFTCGLAHLAGFKTVKQAMNDKAFAAFISCLMMDEIAPSIIRDDLSIEQAVEFTGKVLDRYRNPFIEHQWLSITLQYTSKMAMRNVPLLKSYILQNGSVPGCMSLGLAGYLLFMKCDKATDGKFYGKQNGDTYLVNDNHASWFSEKWRNDDIGQLVNSVFCDKELWGADLTALPGLADAVIEKLTKLMAEGAEEMMYKQTAKK